ncbi:MAG: class I SAM-dependent methyltransferase [Rhodospirillaceae bacterium]|nr:class I SAM-dependent methyltransferase [Rhodospirillaceae bacterium]
MAIPAHDRLRPVADLARPEGKLTGLADKLRQRITADGPITVADYMEACLGDSKYGYYMVNDPFGVDGDFITAPEISQLFGELIGLWAVDYWERMGGPAFHFVELGPGRGTLMADALRASALRPEFIEVCNLHLVETSPALRARQKTTLASAPCSPIWHNAFSDIPDKGPVLVIANEFLDALPVRQFVSWQKSWRERFVDFEKETDRLCFRIGEETVPLPDELAGFENGSHQEGDILEYAPAGTELTRALARRIAATGGAALIIDYGHGESAIGETLQAVRDHKSQGVLDHPGKADLTTHVDFGLTNRLIKQEGARPSRLLPQGAFLETLGIHQRLETLECTATPEQKKNLSEGAQRLIGGEGMGNLFKVLAITASGGPAPAGFN